MPRRYYSYIAEFQPFHIVSTVGTWFLALAFITFVAVEALEAYEARF